MRVSNDIAPGAESWGERGNDKINRGKNFLI